MREERGGREEGREGEGVHVDETEKEWNEGGREGGREGQSEEEGGTE